MLTVAQGISKYGFRSWYERKLIVCHSYLVTALLSLVLVMLLVEQLDWHGPWPMTLLVLAMMAGAAVLGAAAFHRYVHILVSVLALADKCVCAQCRTYGLVQVVAAGRTAQGAEPQWLRLQCKQCGHQWQVVSQLA